MIPLRFNLLKILGTIRGESLRDLVHASAVVAPTWLADFQGTRGSGDSCSPPQPLASKHRRRSNRIPPDLFLRTPQNEQDINAKDKIKMSKTGPSIFFSLLTTSFTRYGIMPRCRALNSYVKINMTTSHKKAGISVAKEILRSRPACQMRPGRPVKIPGKN